MRLHESAGRQEALQVALSKLEALGVDHWVCNGTLLGLVRDEQLIPWDPDIDIAVITDLDKASLAGALEDSTFLLVDPGILSDYLIFQYRGHDVDLNLFFERDDYVETLWLVPKDNWPSRVICKVARAMRISPTRVRRFARLEGYKYLTEDVFPLHRKAVLGLNVNFPRSPERLLEFQYGPSWHIPNQRYRWRKDSPNKATAALN